MSFGGFGGGGDGYPPTNIDLGTGSSRDPIKPWHDEISYEAQHTADLEREEAEGKKRLPSRLIGRLLGTLRSLF
jgi:hypothetical protein